MGSTDSDVVMTIGDRGCALGVTRRSIIGGLMAALLAAPASAAIAACFVAVRLDGHDARLLLDTGAARSVLTVGAVRRMGLSTDRWVDTLLRGAGGRLESHANADVRIAEAGGQRLYQTPGQALSFSVTGQSFGGVDGLLGADILRHFDISVDANGAVTLGRPGESAAGATSVALTMLFPDLLLAPVVLDGRAMTALIDTGAERTLLNARGLYKLGRLPPGAPGAIAALGGGTAVQSHHFTQLVLGALKIEGPTLLAAAVPEAAFDLILGMDIIGQHGFSLSYARRRLSLMV